MKETVYARWCKECGAIGQCTTDPDEQYNQLCSKCYREEVKQAGYAARRKIQDGKTEARWSDARLEELTEIEADDDQ